jgi:hypothetical protein
VSACPQVEVDLGLSAHANARAYYDNRRKHQARQPAWPGVAVPAITKDPPDESLD